MKNIFVSCGCVLTVLCSAVMFAADAPASKPVRLMAEGEDFIITGKDGWAIVPYRENYFASTFAITFLSRMGCLGAPEQVEKPVIATQQVEVPTDGDFFVLSRYEQPYNFAVEFTIEVEQGGKTVYSKLYGRLEDPKVWPLNGHKRVPMERFFWGGTDNIVWQHFDPVKLKAGKAMIKLIAGPQKDGNKLRVNAARRHVDVVCLTNDTVGMKEQAKTKYLEFDGWLTQEGDLFVRATIPAGGTAAAPVFAPSPMGQHSPYSIHTRDWPTITAVKDGRIESPTNHQTAGPRSSAVAAKNLAPLAPPLEDPKKPVPPERLLQPGQTSGWIPLGGALDSLHNSIWEFKTSQPVELEFAKPDGKGGLQSIRKLTVAAPGASFEMPSCIHPNASLAARLKDMGYPPVIATVPERMQWLLAEVKKFPNKGPTPQRFLVYNIMGFGGGLSHPDGMEIAKLLGDNTAVGQAGKKRGLACHWRDPSIASIKKMEEKTPFNDLYIVSYGDEMHLPAVTQNNDRFSAWLKTKGIKYDGPIVYTAKPEDPLFYYSMICGKETGAKQYAEGTAYYKSKGVLTGANYSPHSNYMVTEIDYIRPFKLGALSLAWSEDYVWQIPEFSLQVVGYLTSAFRAGVKYHNDPIHMYVMPHSPGNTPDSFRRSFYTCLAHGMTQVNYFCAGPLAVGSTENYVATDDLGMWRAIHAVSHEAGKFEDYVMDGKVRQAKVGLLLSSVDDILTGDNNATGGTHNMERKAIYYALRHAQVPVDFLSEEDVIEGLAKDYRVIYVCERHLHSKAIEALTKWASAGGTVVAFAGGGLIDEFRKPNPVAGQMYGVKADAPIEEDAAFKALIGPGRTPFLAKQDLPLYQPTNRATVTATDGQSVEIPVMVWKQKLAATDGKVVGKFADGSPAVVEKAHGKGKAVLFGFLPGMAYLKSALPVRPADRGSVDSAFTHFIPTAMDPAIRGVMVDQYLPQGFARPVDCDNPLVETTCIDTPAKNGKPVRLAVPLVNYAGKPVEKLTVSIRDVDKASSVRSVERGDRVPFEVKNGQLVVTLPLDVADVLLIDR